MAVATKSVVGTINNVSAGDITGMTMLFDLDPAWVVVDNTVIVGVQTGGVKGEPVTPDPTTGAFAVDLVAVDNPTWTITVTITGPTVEIPIVISIAPPPATGTGDINFEDLIVPASTPGNPVIIVGPGSGGGAVDSVNGHVGTVNLTYTDVGALAASYTPPAAPVSSVAGRTGAVTLTVADITGAAPSASTLGFVLEVSGSYGNRPSSDTSLVFLWLGPDSPPTTTGKFLSGVDKWLQTAA